MTIELDKQNPVAVKTQDTGHEQPLSEEDYREDEQHLRELQKGRQSSFPDHVACSDCGTVIGVQSVPEEPLFCSKTCLLRYLADVYSYLLPVDKKDSRPPYMLPPIPPPGAPEEAIAWMNAKHFVVQEAGKTIVATEEHDPALKRRVLKRSSFEDIRNFYCNQFVDSVDAKGKPTGVALGKYWLNHRQRRQFEGIICAPNGGTSGYYNLWRGFSVGPRRGDWSLMDAHIRENICAGDPEPYRYVRKWLAFAVQHPDRLPEVALVLRGKQGTGKGVFARAFGALFGQHFIHLAQARHLVGNFNAHLQDAIVVFADEAFLAGDSDAAGMLKMLVTEPVIPIERKFQNVTFATNLTHLIIASNHDWIIPAAAEERRFCVLDVSEKRMQDHDYFAGIVQQMEHGGREAMLYDLLNEGLSNVNIRQFPVTDGLRDQKVLSLRPHEKWWFQKLNDGHLLPGDDKWETVTIRDGLLEDFISTSSENCTSQELRNQLVRLLPEGYPKDGPRPLVGSSRKRTWVFPHLAECRSRFDSLFKTTHSWPKQLTDESEEQDVSDESILIAEPGHTSAADSIGHVQHVQVVQPLLKGRRIRENETGVGGL